MNLNSYLIKQEINRFECVHPCIYAAYDIVDQLGDDEKAEEIRNHLIAIEDAFVNSQEWTLCRSVDEVRLAFLGSHKSGKSALVHYFLTGIYIKDQSPEGGRFKKLCFTQTQPCLLLIRDEAGPPDVQLASWIDAFVFVVSLGDLDSVILASSYYTLLRGLVDLSSIPLVLVATQDSVLNGTPSPEVEAHLRQLIATMNSCLYYETCAVYGLNIDALFNDIMTRVLADKNRTSNTQATGNGYARDSSIQSCSATTCSPPTTAPTSTLQSTQNPSGQKPGSVCAPSHPSSFRNALDIQPHTAPLHVLGPPVRPESINSFSTPCRPPQMVSPPSMVAPISRPISSVPSPASLPPRSNPPIPPSALQVNPPALRMLQPYGDLLTAVPSGNVCPSGTLHTSWIYQPTQQPLPNSTPLVNSSMASLVHPFASLSIANGTRYQSENGPLYSVQMSAATTQMLGTTVAETYSGLPYAAWHCNGAPPVSYFHGQSTLKDGQLLVVNNLVQSELYGLNGVQHPQLIPLAGMASVQSGSSSMSSASAQAVEQRGQQPSIERSAPTVSSPDLTISASNRRAPTNLFRRSDIETTSLNTPGTAQPTHRLSDEPSKRDRPRPQSTGSLTGPLSGLASATLCTMGLHSGSGSTKQRDNLGAGRLIPLKQGYLYKHTNKRLSKEMKRKKKYVVITEDARLAYHPSKQDYINRQHCKWIDLTISTVKLPGMAYRMSSYATGVVGTSPSIDSPQPRSMNQCVTDMNSSFFLPSVPNTSTITSTPKTSNNLGSTTQTGLASLMDSTTSFLTSSIEQTDAVRTSTDLLPPIDTSQLDSSNKSSPNPSRLPAGRTLKEAMKRHYRRAKAAVSDPPSDTENHEFVVVTADSTQWHFEAPSQAERDDWIQQIEAVIHNRLRSSASGVRDDSATDRLNNTSILPLSGLKINGEQRLTPRATHHARPLSFTTGTTGFFKDGAGEEDCGQEEVLKRLTALPGNDSCADCGAAHPEWASLNLGVLICIECSGVHRELGTHISRVRSATLDTWTREHLAVMTSFGNTLANSVWEGAAPSQAKQFRKPEPNSPRDVRAAWIQNKYVRRLFLPPLPLGNSPTQKDFADALLRKDARNLLICLALSNSSPSRTSTELSPVNMAYSAWDSRTPLHLAAALGDLAFLQLLLWHGADVNSTDQFGLTAWTHAQICRQDSCARLLQALGCRCIPPINIPIEWLQCVQRPLEIGRNASATCTNSQTDSDTDSRSCTSSFDEDSSTTERHSGTAVKLTADQSK